MNSRPSDRPPCGSLLPNFIRYFCHKASCKICLRHACRRRAQIFVRRCGLSSDFGATVSFFAPLDAAIPFESWRRRLHDAVDHRRGMNRNWWSFGLIARFDGDFIRGVARLGNLGTHDFSNLIGPAEIARMENFAAETVARTLDVGPFVPLPGSLKNIFVTSNPRVRRHGRRAWTATDEPMPIIF